MKNKLTLLATFLLLSWGVFAQNVPEKINYQAVARNLAGIPLVSTPIIVVFDIIQGSQTGPSVYSETHVDTTNQFGLFNLEIGGGTTSGNFSTINWSSGSYYLRVTVNGDVMPATQLLSVPYALHAKTATSGVPGADGYNSLLDTLSAGAVCPNGGYQVLMGLDTDASGILDAGEVTKTFIVCNGADGATGPAGANGTTYFAGNGISLSNDTITNLGDADNDSSNELITLTNLNGNIIEITESGTLHSIDLTSVLGASYTQGAGISIVGNTISASDTSITNELQTLSLNIAQDSIFISSGNGIQLPNTTGADDWGNDTVNVAGGNIMGSGTVSNPLMVIDNDTSATNEFQDLSVNATNGNEINISNGTGFFLSQVPPSATNQVLTWNGSNWVAQNPGSGADNWGTQYVIADGTTITGTGIAGDTLRGFDGDYNSLSNQPTIPTNTSDLTNDSGFITNPDDADFDPNNEIQNLTISGNYIGVSGGLGDSISAVQPAIGDYLYWNGVNWIGQSIAGNTDNQNLGNGGKSGNDQTLVIQNGTGVTFSVADGDSVATNELQTISASGGTSPQIDLSIGGGNVKILGTGGTTVNQAGNAITINSTTGTTYTAGTGIDITTGTISNTSLNTDDQQLTYNSGSQTLSLSTTTTPSVVTLDVNDADADPNNEIQTLSFTSPNLTISGTGGNTVDLSGLSSATFWSQTGNNIYPTTIANNVGIGFASPTARLQIDNNATARSVDLNNYLNSTSNTHVLYGNNGGTGSGDKYGAQMSTTGAGGNSNYGFYGSASNATGSNFGLYGSAQSSGTSTAHGVYSTVNGGGTGDNYAVYAVNSGTSSGASYAGIFNNYNSTGSIIYGVRSQVTGNAPGTSKFGFRADVSGNAGVNYGGYFNAIGGGTNWAGYFASGDVYIQNTLVLPTGAANNYVLKSDAAGNASWADISTLSPATFWSQTGNNIYPTTIANNVGIGTSTPALGRKLEVINNDVVANNMAIHGQSSGANASNIGVQGYALNSTSQNVGVSGIGQGNTGTNYGVSGSATGAATTNMGVYGNASGGTNNYAGYFSGGNVYVTNNLGVGISSPTHKLDVQSNSFELLKLTTTGANSNVNVDINTTGSGAAQFTVTGGTGGFSFVTDGTWPTSAMNIIDNGNVGIGINPPTSKLHVQGSGSTSVTSALNVQNSSGVSSLYVRDDGDIGIGTTSPAMKLNISDNTTTITPQFEIENTSTGDAAMRFDGGGNYFSVGIDYSDGTKFKISDYTQLGTNDRLTIDLSGKVGIGTTNPSYKLQVEDAAVRRTGYFMNTTNAGNIVNDELMGIYGGAHGSGASDKIGGFFETSSGSGVNYGVYAQAMGGATNWAGYFESGNVYIQNNLGVGVTSPSSKLDVNGTINISNNAGEINNSVKTGAANLLPIAYGNIAQDANINASTGNFSVIWNATNLWYEITIIGEAFNFSNYIVNVTRISGISGVTEATSSLGGKLIVVFNDQGGTKVQNAFQFVVYKP